MADSLQRTLKRGVALLLVPLCSLVMGMERYVWSDQYGLYPPDTLGRLALVVVPTSLWLGAVTYLVLSVAGDLGRTMSPDGDAESTDGESGADVTDEGP